jgi:TonB family protein
VALNGAAVLHRTGVGYPAAARRDGVQGTVSVQVKLDSTGVVNDAQVLSGPDELRKAVLESVLQWHFTKEAAGATREIQIAFELPKGASAAAPAATTPAMGRTGTIRSIRVQGLSEQASAELLASLPIHEGDEWNGDTAMRANQAVKAFDEHLAIRQSSMTQSPGGAAQLDLEIAATSGRITVGGNVQVAMIVSKTPPIYPAAAKAAGIQGVVHLSAIIGTDGTVQELMALSGPPELTQAAMDAVKQWVYKPTLLNGSPVQVQTTIDINFTLNR